MSKEKQTYVLVPIEWLQDLEKDAKRIGEMLDKNGYDIGHADLRYPLVGLVGFCKSATTVLTNKRIQK